MTYLLDLHNNLKWGEFIRPIIIEGCKIAEVPHLASRIAIYWSNRMTRTVAYASYNHLTNIGRIKISTKLFSVMKSDAARRETILHELAHIITQYNHRGLIESNEGHGDLWRSYATQIGSSGKRFVSNDELDITPFRRRQQRFIIKCKCGRVYTVSKNRLTRMRNRKYICTICKSIMEV